MLYHKCGRQNSLYHKSDIDGLKQMMAKFGAKAVVNARDGHGRTCLHNAVFHRQTEIITLLVKNGADLESISAEGYTPLAWAIRYRRYSCITTLVKLGASLLKAKESPEAKHWSYIAEKEKIKAAIAKGHRLAGVCYNGPQGKDYRGTRNSTLTGKACQKWAVHTPHEHRHITPALFPNDGLDSNYCRNPSNGDGPWCYTTTSKRWEYCLIKC